MKKGFFKLFTFGLLTLSYLQASARIWRVNNRPGVNADFKDFGAAVATAAAGDTLYVEGSPISYNIGSYTSNGYYSIAKKITIFGAGYYLSGNNPNPNTQAVPYPSTIAGLVFNSGSAGSVAAGLSLGEVDISDNNITIERNNLENGILYLAYTGDASGDTIRQNMIDRILAYTPTYAARNVLIYNNIIKYGIDLGIAIYNSSGYIINNNVGATVYSGSRILVANFILQNNILYVPDLSPTVDSNLYYNNIISTSSAASGIPTGNGNVFNVSDFTTVYVGWGQATINNYSPDGAYALTSSSPAIGAGIMNGTRVDCGAFGGPARYVLSGMPAIPSIYAFSAPSQVSAGASNINVSISSASH